MVRLLLEKTIREMLLKDKEWIGQESWWTGDSGRYRNAPFGFDIEVMDTSVDINGKKGEYKAIVYRAEVDMESGEIMMNCNENAVVLKFVFTECSLSLGDTLNYELLTEAQSAMLGILQNGLYENVEEIMKNRLTVDPYYLGRFEVLMSILVENEIFLCCESTQEMQRLYKYITGTYVLNVEAEDV